MKVYYSLLFALLSFVVQAQQAFRSGGQLSYSFVYTPIDSRPTLGTNAILTYSAPGNILNSTGGTTQDKILRGSWTEFHAFSFTGTLGTNRRISNEDNSTIIGSVANHLFTLEGTGSTYLEINGKSPTEAFYFKDVGSVSATSALQITASASTPNIWINNVVNDSRGYAVFANTSGTLSGGNSTTPTSSSNNYQTVSGKFIRSFNATGNKEHYYIGSTTTSAYAIHQNFSLEHSLGYQSEWDGIQLQNCKNFYINKITIVNAGTLNVASQNASLQLQNSYGTAENSIFMGAPQGLRFTSQNITFRNNYVQWTGNIANQILSYYGNYTSTQRLMVDPTTVEILIDGCDFVSTTWTGELFDVFDPDVRIRVTNCRIEGPTSLFKDSRGGSPTGSMTDGGGNVFVPTGTIKTPTFTNFIPTDYTGHGLLTEPTHHKKGRGYRSPY